MRVTISPERVPARPGSPTSVAIQIDNTDDRPVSYRVRTLGLDDAWEPTTFVTDPVEPGGSTTVDFILTLPRGTPAGAHLTGIEVSALGLAPVPEDEGVVVHEVMVEVGAADAVTVSLEPRHIDTRRGKFRLILRNRTREPVDLELSSASPDPELRVRFESPEIRLEGGEQKAVRGRVRTRRNWVGDAVRSGFTIVAQGFTTPLQLEGSISRGPRFSRGVMKVVALATLIALWGSLLVVGMNVIRNRNADDRGLPIAQLDEREGGGSGGGDDAADQKGGSGGSGGGADGEGPPDGEGAPSEDAVVGGQVKAAEPAGFTVKLEAVSLSDDLSGAQFTSTVKEAGGPTKIVAARPALTKRRAVPEIRSTKTDKTGTYAFGQVPSPRLYRLTISKPGYTTRAFIVQTGVTAETVVVDAELEAGTGNLGGTVRSGDAPLGGVDITVTDGTLTFNTRTPTTGANVGQWSVVGISTPGTYVVTAKRRGFGTQSRLIELGGGSSIPDVDITLRAGVGSVSGLINSADGPVAGATVSVTDGTFTRTTSTLSEGVPGAYLIPQVPIPGTYTLTIEASGWLTQSKTIELTGNVDEGTTLIRATATLSGIITNAATQGPIATAGLTLIKPTDPGTTSVSPTTASTATAHTFKGTSTTDGYQLAGIPPGTYLLTVEHFSFDVATALVTLGAGEVKDLNVALSPRDINAVPTTGKANGVVVDSIDKAPLPNVEVKVDGASANPKIVTNALGAFEVAGLTPGVHALQFVNSSYSTGRRTVPVGIGQDVGIGTIELVRLAKIKVGVTNDTGGTPLPDITLCLFRRPAGAAFTATHPPDNQCVLPTGTSTLPKTDAAGAFEFTVNAGITFDLYFSDRTLVAPTNLARYIESATAGLVVPVGQTDLGTNERLDARPVIDIHTQDPSKPPTVTDVDDAALTVTPPAPFTVTLPNTGATGRLNGVVLPAAGSYTIGATKTGLAPTSTAFTMNNNQTRTIRLPLTAGATNTEGLLQYEAHTQSGTQLKGVKKATVTLDAITGYERKSDDSVGPVTGPLTSDALDNAAGETSSGTGFPEGKFIFSGANAPLKGAARIGFSAKGFTPLSNQSFNAPDTNLVYRLNPTSTVKVEGTITQRDSDTVTAASPSVNTKSITGFANPVSINSPSAGKYSASSLPPGDHQVNFAKSGYEVVTPGSPPTAFTGLFSVEPADASDAAQAAPSVELRKLASLSVRATGLREGTTATMTLKQGSSGGGACNGTQVGSSQAGTAPANGQVTLTFSSLPGGDSGAEKHYCATVVRTKLGAPETMDSAHVAVRIGHVATAADVTVSFTAPSAILGHLRGQLTTGFYENVPGVTITASSTGLTPSVTNTAVSGSNGEFTVVDLAASDGAPGGSGYSITTPATAPTGYTTTSATQGDIDVAVGATADVRTSKPLTLIAQKGSLTGQAKTVANPAGENGVTVTAFNQIDPSATPIQVVTANDGTNDGAYAFNANLDPVNYTIRFTKDGLRDLERPVQISKGGSQTLTVDLVVATSTVTGQVRGKIGAGTPTGANVNGGSSITATLLSPGTTTAVTATGLTNPVTASFDAGAQRMRYQFSEVPQGFYDIEVKKPGWGSFVVEDVEVASSLPITAPTVDLVARDRPVAVNLTTTNGGNLAGVAVSLAPDSAATNPGVGSPSAITASGGAATFTTVTPGSYIITVDGNAEGYTNPVVAGNNNELTVPADVVDSTTTYTHAPGTPLSIEPLLKVVVEDTATDPIQSASVVVATVTTGDLPTPQSTNTDGAAFFTATAGTHSATASKATYASRSDSNFTVASGTSQTVRTITLPKLTDITVALEDGDDSSAVTGGTVTVKLSGTTVGTGAAPLDVDDLDPDASYTVDVTVTGYDPIVGAALPTFNESATRQTVTVTLTRTPRTVTINVEDFDGALHLASVTIKDGGSPVATGQTNNGTFTSTAIAPKDGYKVEVTKAGYDPITVAAGNAVTLDLPVGSGSYTLTPAIHLKMLVDVVVTVSGAATSDAQLFDGVTLKHSSGAGTSPRTIANVVPGEYTLKIVHAATADCGTLTVADDGADDNVSKTVSGTTCT